MPHTAKELCARLHAYGLYADGAALVFCTPLPLELEAAVAVLQTGVRAERLGRAWWGSASNKVRMVPLQPAEPVPDDIGLLAVGGDASWDSIRPDAQLDFPRLFEPRTRVR
jgi:hypothetical protein